VVRGRRRFQRNAPGARAMTSILLTTPRACSACLSAVF
jgi:hypothetical protein